MRNLFITYLVFLVAFEQSLSTSDILGKFISRDDCLHVRNPADEVTEV